MIKAIELRIGNLIYLELGLAGLSVHKIKAQDIADYANGRITIEAVKPIHLTPEWLERLGFENGIYTYYDGSTKEAFIQPGQRYVVTKLEIGTDYDCYGVEFFPYKQAQTCIPGLIRYVHQLQNLYFALTGEELTIKEKV